MEAEALRRLIQDEARLLEERGVALSRGAFGACIGWMNRVFGSDALRRLVCAWIFDFEQGEMHASDMSPPQVKAMLSWLGLSEVEGEWVARAGVYDEARAMVEAAAAACRQGLRPRPPSLDILLTAVIDLEGSVGRVDEPPDPPSCDPDLLEVALEQVARRRRVASVAVEGTPAEASVPSEGKSVEAEPAQRPSCQGGKRRRRRVRFSFEYHWPSAADKEVFF